MSGFNQDKFNKFVIDNEVLGFFPEPITLASGRKSHWYVNWRKVSNDVFLINELADYVINFAEDLEIMPNTFYGVPEGATKLAIITQFKMAMCDEYFSQGSHTLSMGRGKRKDHGKIKDKYFVGEPKGSIILLEDVTTTGSSLLESIDRVDELDNVFISAAVGLTNRMELTNEGESVEQAVLKKGIPYYELSKGTELLKLAYDKLKPDKKIIQYIEAEFDNHGIEPLKIM